MTRPRVVLVGAGVAGAIVAAKVAPHCELLVLEVGNASVPPTNPREAMSGSADFVSMPYPSGRGLGGGSRINGLVLEHAPSSYWQELALDRGIATFAKANIGEITTRFSGEEASCIGSLDQVLLNAHPDARRARLSTREGRRLTAWDRAATTNRGTVRLDCEVECVTVRNGRARSVLLRGGEEVRADHVILCAGAVSSAVLALRSGIGGEHVGQGMLDHPSIFVPVTGSIGECQTFAGALGYENQVMTMSVNPTSQEVGGFLLGLMRTSSIGRVSLAGDNVLVERGMRADSSVRTEMSHAMQRLIEMIPSTSQSMIDDPDKWHSRVGEGMWHAAGTMRMGSSVDAVTDANGLVRGTENVWCMDAAVFPVIPPVPIQGPTMVAADVLADGFVSLATT